MARPCARTTRITPGSRNRLRGSSGAHRRPAGGRPRARPTISQSKAWHRLPPHGQRRRSWIHVPFPELYARVNLALPNRRPPSPRASQSGGRWPALRTVRPQQTSGVWPTSSCTSVTGARTCPVRNRHGPVEIDHIVPLERERPDPSNNLCVLCRTCKRAHSKHRNWSDSPMLPVTACSTPASTSTAATVSCTAGAIDTHQPRARSAATAPASKPSSSRHGCSDPAALHTKPDRDHPTPSFVSR